MRKSRMPLKCGVNNRLICKENPICDINFQSISVEKADSYLTKVGLAVNM